MKKTNANFITPKKLELHKISFFNKTKFFSGAEILKGGGARRLLVIFITLTLSICTNMIFLKSIS